MIKIHQYACQQTLTLQREKYMEQLHERICLNTPIQMGVIATDVLQQDM